jgi:hypothetical protein
VEEVGDLVAFLGEHLLKGLLFDPSYLNFLLFMYILEVSFPLSQFVLFLPLALVFEISVVQMGVVSQVQGA